MTNKEKMEIGLALNKIALSLDEQTLDNLKKDISKIENIIASEPTKDGVLAAVDDIAKYCKRIGCHRCIFSGAVVKDDSKNIYQYECRLIQKGCLPCQWSNISINEEFLEITENES